VQAAFGRRFESSLHCVLDFGFRLAYIVQAAFAFCGMMKRGAKHRLSSFCDYLRHGQRVACNVDMAAAQRHALLQF